MINVQLHHAGKKIILLKTSRSTVYHTVSKFKEYNSTEDCSQSKRPQFARTPKAINTVKERVRRNPKKFIKEMARNMNVSEKTMRNYC